MNVSNWLKVAILRSFVTVRLVPLICKRIKISDRFSLISDELYSYDNVYSSSAVTLCVDTVPISVRTKWT